QYLCPVCRDRELGQLLVKLQDVDRCGMFASPVDEDLAPHY
ncbi:unnamed protein product, partial [Phaeothamnion confervicola]